MDKKLNDEIAVPEEIKTSLKNVVNEHKNAAIGAGVSAAVGAAFGGPIGAAVGGALGGYVGSLFDGEQTDTDGKRGK
ncbi:MAG TPA: hypothetical protein PKW95_23015 [bacterium]|nr:hypothetical protein [bacterium]